jgi:hypothetical protein
MTHADKRAEKALAQMKQFTSAPLTLEEAKALKTGDWIYSRFDFDSRGNPRRFKVNGMPKTWKRDPSRVRVPLKYGMYEFGYITEDTLNNYTLTDTSF